MVIREAGLLFRGFTLVNGLYHQTGGNEIDTDLRSGLLTAIINFAENAFSTQLVEYFEGRKYVIAFREDMIVSVDSMRPELLIGYAILDKEKKLDKHNRKVVQPLLKKVIYKFKLNHEGKNLSEISQFRPFIQILNKIIGKESIKLVKN